VAAEIRGRGGRNEGIGDSVKIKTTRQNLLNLLSRIAPVADAKSTMPILANVLLRADPDGRFANGYVDVDGDGRWDIALTDSDGDGAADGAAAL
jgi:hypothetical protein